MSAPPKDGSVFYIRQAAIFPCKWKPYSPKSEQVRKHGIMGRWQAMNDYAGWDNVDLKDGQYDWAKSFEDLQTMRQEIEAKDEIGRAHV